MLTCGDKKKESSSPFTAQKNHFLISKLFSKHEVQCPGIAVLGLELFTLNTEDKQYNVSDNQRTFPASTSVPQDTCRVVPQKSVLP